MNRGTYKIRRNRATDLLFMYLVLKKGAFRTQHTENNSKNRDVEQTAVYIISGATSVKSKVLRLSMCRTVHRTDIQNRPLISEIKFINHH